MENIATNASIPRQFDFLISLKNRLNTFLQALHNALRILRFNFETQKKKTTNKLLIKAI